VKQIILAEFGNPDVGAPQLRLHHVGVMTT
jgi:hypothetical protein